ncbi:MAG: hypothetical protein LC768_08480 [Acidobacteria bacterium]|nr:hypothetical protein [Acidobacteriota bacterium]MCA1638355.1 hypothetical protein [Acidobacteriota bacterium]
MANSERLLCVSRDGVPLNKGSGAKLFARPHPEIRLLVGKCYKRVIIFPDFSIRKSSLGSIVSTKKLYAGSDPLIGILRDLSSVT